MTKAEAIQAAIDYFSENEHEFNDCIEELDGYNGYLGDNRFYCMDEMDDLFSNETPTWILYRAFYGYDAESWTTDSCGNRIYSEFNPNREYFTFNGYGNFISANYKDYSEYLDDNFIESLFEDMNSLCNSTIPCEIAEIYQAYEEAEE